jgi:ketosteroid isomerase-like protein
VRTTTRAVTAFTLLVLLGACAREMTELSQADQDAVKAHIEKYRQAVVANDWEAMGNTLAADVVLSPSNVAPLAGRDAAVAWSKTFPTITGFTVNVEEVSGVGALAYARGTYQLDMRLPDSSVATDRGAFIEIHRRQADGTWPYTRISFHSTEPVPAVAAATRR